ncbi:MAG TPA: HEAT repeat domain-containing protein, partial [Longimicrobiaceae bacterium]|nr:HEAT repeat domain-containing protein [Longimicrobiaceae bacterium]
PGGALDVTLQTGGSLRIVGWDREEVHVRAVVNGRDWRLVRMSLAGDRRRAELTSDFEGSRMTYDAGQTIEVRVPRRFDVRVHSEGGAVEIAGVTGELSGQTEGGPLTLVRAAGTAHFFTEGGSAEIRDTRLDGRIVTEDGGVTLGRNEGNLDIVGGGDTDIDTDEDGVNTINVGQRRNRAGREPLRGVPGRVLRLDQPGGPIVVSEAPGGAVLSTGGGPITIGSAGGRVEAKTGGGDVRIQALRGSARVVTGAGDVGIGLVAGARGEVEVESGNGGVTIHVPEGFAGELDLETAYTRRHGPTRIHSDLPLRQSRTERWDEPNGGTARRYVRATGRVGRGGSKVFVRTVNGDIRIVRGRAGDATNVSVGDVSIDCQGSDCVIDDGAGQTITINPSSASSTGGGSSDAELYRLAMGERDEDVRLGVLSALAGIPHDEGLDELIALSERHPDAETRRRVVNILGEKGCDESVAALETAAFRDADVRVQLAAIDALAEAYDAGGLDELEPLDVLGTLEKVRRTHPSARVRARAGEALSELSR